MNQQQKMPVYGRCDIVAKKDGVLYLVECKVGTPWEVAKGLGQVLMYAEQWRVSVRPVLACPSNAVSESLRRVCRRCGVELWTERDFPAGRSPGR